MNFEKTLKFQGYGHQNWTALRLQNIYSVQNNLKDSHDVVITKLCDFVEKKDYLISARTLVRKFGH